MTGAPLAVQGQKFLPARTWWHHHVVLHELGRALTVHPDGTSQVRNPTGKIIRSHSPPPHSG
jgi:hypothetical protein